MSKSYISLNEINLDTLVDYVDKSVITSGILNPHVNALRDYYFNSDINFTAFKFALLPFSALI